MNPSLRRVRAMLAVVGLAGIAAFAAVIGTSTPAPSEAFNPQNRITIHVAGPDAGKVELDVWDSMLPQLLLNEDTGEYLVPTNYCGLEMRLVNSIHWYDGDGNLVEAENHGEIIWNGTTYTFMGVPATMDYLDGMRFTGPISTCDENQPWYFPGPLSYGGNGPQFGAEVLVLNLDYPQGYHHTIEFLDHAQKPMALPDIYKNMKPLPKGSDYCKQIPEFCDEGNPPKPDMGFQICTFHIDDCWTDTSEPGPILDTRQGYNVAPIEPPEPWLHGTP